MKYRTRESVFNFIMVAIRKVLYIVLKLDKHRKFRMYRDNNGYIPVLSYHPRNEIYRFNCYCFSCPCNFEGLCGSYFCEIPHNLMHEFDGDNCVKNFCG